MIILNFKVIFDDSVTVFKAIHLVCVHHPSFYTESTTYTRVYLWAKYRVKQK